MDAYYAHSSPNGNLPPDGWQLLREHLQGVAELAKRLAEKSGVPELAPAAEAAGWLHDLGKYRASFQEYICGLSPRGSKAHKQAGAAWVHQELKSISVAFAILGHHGGMPDKDDASKEIKDDDGLPVCDEVRAEALKECPELSKLATTLPKGFPPELFARMIFSCLVDADWTNTSEHERKVKNWPQYPTPPELNPDVRLKSLCAYINERAKTTRANNPELANTRQIILDACLAAAALPPSMFMLTVPTGGGKTLSSLAFALKHAATHNRLRRIIYVAPFISIIDQNADVIRAALGIKAGDLTLLEHQSLAEPEPFGPEKESQTLSHEQEKQKATAGRLAENWDAPIVVTSNVQFFESLFSNKPGRCRKLHNIAQSVIILDECQSIPPDLFQPTCQMLKQLVEHLGCTVVLCTATQPAFDHEKLAEQRITAQEIIPEDAKLFDRLKRVTLHWPKDDNERLEWSEVAKRMTKQLSSLCIVNTKAAAQNLYTELQKLPKPAFHLSTNMCPAHRMAVLEDVKKRLMEKQPVYVVSTQLIEAGVDIDFPSVFREMGPLESIIQAAGRCNREGLMLHAGGNVFVFRSIEGETKIPPGWYRKGRDTVETSLKLDEPPRIDFAEDIRAYFGRVYWNGNLDAKNIVGSRNGCKFKSCAEAYRLITEDTVPLVVASWKPHELEIEQLFTNLRQRPTRANYRALAPFQVNVYRNQLTRFGPNIEQWEDSEVRIWRGKYSPEIGLLAENPDDLIV